MTYTPTIYDWRDDVQPLDQFFRAGGASVAGGMTLGGASIENPEPGGRAELMMNFSRLALASANLNASWTLSRILNGSVMRIRLFLPSVQIVTDAALGIVSTAGVTWSNALPWSSGQPWRANPSAPITAAASKGASTFTCDMSGPGQALKIGHVIGFHVEYDFAHVVTDIAYSSANEATVTVQPPLRRALTTANQVLFRPVMLVTCANARDVADNFRWGQSMALNSAKFVEALA